MQLLKVQDASGAEDVFVEDIKCHLSGSGQHLLEVVNHVHRTLIHQVGQLHLQPFRTENWF